MKDLLEGCISSVDVERKDYQAFMETFCVRCRNIECKHALGHKDKFSVRVSHQWDRMFQVERADPTSSRYEHLQDFPSLLRQAMQQEIVDKRGDWTVPEIPILDGRVQSSSPQTTQAIDEATQSLAGDRGRKITLPEPEPDKPEPDPPKSPTHYMGSTPAAVPKPGNTPKPKSGIMVGGAPVPEKTRDPDPWAPPKSVGRVVKPGATIQFGSDEDDTDE